MTTISPICATQHILMKFVSEKEYAEDLLRGYLYMNSLDYFWNEFKLSDNGVPGQMDLFEGIYGYLDVSKFGFEPTWQKLLTSDIAVRAEGYKYCHIHSYYRLDYWFDYSIMDSIGIVKYDDTSSMKQFGKYVVIIDNEIEFLRRIGEMAAKQKQIYFLCGNVKYREMRKYGQIVPYKKCMTLKLKDHLVDVREQKYNNIMTRKYDVFDKMKAMAYQKEWRIAIYENEKNVEAKKFFISEGIQDIAHIVEVDYLDEEIKKMFCLRRPNNGNVGWYGNISRKELREKFYELGDYKGSVLSVC